MDLLNINKISLSYGAQQVLRQISFHLQSKEIVCVIGESGCGKTTLLKSIQGLVDLNEGEITYLGNKVKGPADQLVPGTQGISTVYQDFNLEENLSVYYNIKRELNFLKNSQQEKITQKVLKACNISKIADKFPRQISGGQRQKVALAKALVTQPKLILLDEPFSNLDNISKQNFKDLIFELKESLGISFLYVTHDITDALTFADKIIILDKGKVVLNCLTEQLYHRISSVYVAKILSLKNLIQGKVLNDVFGLNCLSNKTYWVPFSAINYYPSKIETRFLVKNYFLGDENLLCFSIQKLV